MPKHLTAEGVVEEWIFDVGAQPFAFPSRSSSINI
jgi:hypothetical protein